MNNDNLVSTCANAGAIRCTNAPALGLMRAIKSPLWQTRIERLRHRRTVSGKPAADRVKKQLPAIAWSVSEFAENHRGKSNVRKHSGLICVDFDHVESLAHVRAQCGESPHCFGAFVSPSGDGLKAIFACDPNQPHALSWLAVVAHVRAFLGEEIAGAVDVATKDVSRLCFVSFDPEAYIASGPVQPVSYEGISLPAAPVASHSAIDNGGLLSPGDDFNRRGDLPALLAVHGWTDLGGGNWARPGKTSGVSASILPAEGDTPALFHNFSSNAQPLEGGKTYAPFALYALLEYNNDFKAAASALRSLGFGEEPTEADYEALFGGGDASTDEPEPDDATPAQYAQLFGGDASTDEPEAEAEPDDAPPLDRLEPDDGLEAEPDDGLKTATDLGANDRLAAGYANVLRYTPGLGWRTWDGKRWAADRTGRAMEISKHCARAWTRTCMGAVVEREKRIREALTLESAQHIRGALDLAKTEAALVLEASDLDGDDWVLNCQNGTLDLRTGRLRPHRRDDKISKLAPVRFVAGATHPVLEKFLAGLELRTPGMAAFLARCFGACLTGDSSPETLFLLAGAGGSGKTTLTEAVASMLGDYSAKLPFESFCLSKNGRSPGGAAPDLMKLRGSRLAYASEGDASARLDAGLVKTLTGGEPLSARNLYEKEQIAIPQTWKTWMVSNYDPRADSDDTGLWRRMLRIPFEAIPAAERDPRVKKTLCEDSAARSALLAWALAGCLDWQTRGGGRIGLAPPEACEQATHEYRSRQDPLSSWWAELTYDANLVPFGFTTSAALWKHYTDFCDQNGVARPVSNRRFASYLESKGLLRRATTAARGWEGISLNSEQ